MKSIANSENKCRSSHIKDARSLLSKYHIPVNHLDFNYVENCQDRKHLERILEVLESGQEGYYPELIVAVRKQLETVYPKSKLLGNISSVISKNEMDNEKWNEMIQDVNDWILNVSEADRELAFQTGQRISYSTEIKKIRQCEVFVEVKDTTPQKINSTDYTAWEKYDVDAEILNMDLKEEKLMNLAKMQNSCEFRKNDVKFDILATDVERKAEAAKEREKGNEYFKAGEYELALNCYSVSVDCIPTIEAYNNRALTYLKLNKYENCIEDCNLALKLEPLCLKANWRKSIALYYSEDFENALKFVEKCVDLEPNNARIQNFANSIRTNCKKECSDVRRIRVENVGQ